MKEYYQANKEQYKARAKAWYQAHKEQRKANKKSYYQANKEQRKAQVKAYYQAHKEQYKAYYQTNKEQYKAQMKAYYQAHKEQAKAYMRSDVNSLGQTKISIRVKSLKILKKSGIKIPGYEIHHCFGYEDPSKFIYISRSLHLKIHQYLRDNNIDADTDHWMAIRDIVNSTDEFTYIKC